jgi:hypothetical protein
MGSLLLSFAILFVSSPSVKMRGNSSTPRIDPATFIIMDRLYGTLEDKIGEWATTKKENKGDCMGMGANVAALSQLSTERLVVAYDLTCAFRYLHTSL